MFNFTESQTIGLEWILARSTFTSYDYVDTILMNYNVNDFPPGLYHAQPYPVSLII